MDLTAALLRAGATRPHVLTAPMPGGTAVRLAVEEQLRRRGWPAASTPADADLLLVAGDVVAQLADPLDEIWRAMPAPRARAHVAHPGAVTAALDAVPPELADRVRQRLRTPAAAADAQERRGPPVHDGGGSRPDRDHDASTTGDRAAGEHGHDMGGMELPGGLPMADRGADRDGLRLDQLHVPLGPVLPDWPTGLVVSLALQGDVVQHADVDTLGVGAAAGSFWTEPWRRAAAGAPVTTGTAARRRIAAHLDSLGRFLAVAGWDDAATTARRLRDDALATVAPGRLPFGVRRFATRVAGSRTLAWSTRRLGVLRPDDAVAAGMRGPALRAAGDVTARYRRWCTELVELSAAIADGWPLDPVGLEPPRGRLAGTAAPSAALLAVLPRLLEGVELAAARLIVASLDPDLDELAAEVEVGHGR